MDDGESYDLDDLSMISGLKNGALMSKLVALELEGLVRRVDGGRYRRLPG
jgi:predicted Rossmann fold nucleotide-binding protein DprA/Smf involved in DNA uptake